MFLWPIIFIVVSSAFVGGILYICNKIKKLGIKNNFIPPLIVLFGVLLVALPLGFVSAVVVLIHIILVLLVLDAFLFILSKLTKKKYNNLISSALSLIIVSVYLFFGIVRVYDVKETNYSFKSSKLSEKYRVALFADSHVGTTFSGEGIEKWLLEIESKSPDLIVISGDFVDDSTSKKDMIEACKRLGNVKTKYGIYFVHGNHDKGYYSLRRGFSAKDLENELEKNGVTVLKDEVTLINDEIYIIGRKDFEDRKRASIDELIKDLDKSKYMIVLNHQPTDYENESNANVDLVLSGHTHGGNLIPINLINEKISANNATYGHKTIGNTEFIVTSGISDWALKFRTGSISEYVIIDLDN